MAKRLGDIIWIKEVRDARTAAEPAPAELGVQASTAEPRPEARPGRSVSRQLIKWGIESGNLDLDDIETRPSINQTELFDGNSVLRGQPPIVES